jgi:N4-gp56 family major capsid protein
MPITTTSQVPPEVRTYFDRLLLTLARPYFIYDMFAQKRTIPLNSGDQMVFRRYSTLSAATVPITDGTTPPGSALSVTDFSTQIKWYGNFVVITDQVQFTVQDRVLNESTRVLSLQLGLTLDTLIRNMMVATASSINCQYGTNGGTPTNITTQDIKLAVRALRLGNARLLTKPIQGENRFATSPVRSSYWGFMDVNSQVDLEACADFLSAANYPNPMDALEAEWGSTNNVRWLISTNGFTSTDASPVYNNIILGQEAYGVVKLGSKEAEFIVKPLGSSGTSDPLNQRGSVGYKYPFATRLLNDNWITRINATLLYN